MERAHAARSITAFTPHCLCPAAARSAAAADGALLARIWSGIHFRFAMFDTRDVDEQIAAYVLSHAAQPLHGKKSGQLAD
jgi:hypothetical protein